MRNSGGLMPAAFPGVNCFPNGRACARSFLCHDAAPWGYSFSLYSQLLCSNKKIVEHITHFSNGKARENAKDSSIRPHEQRGVASPLPPFLIDKPPKSRSFLCDKGAGDVQQGNLRGAVYTERQDTHGISDVTPDHRAEKWIFSVLGKNTSSNRSCDR